MPLYFDGDCPESQLQGRQVPMRLNEDDFWESPATGLQLTVFPPYAVVLRWRGSGAFRSGDAPQPAPEGLLLCGAKGEEGAELFPDPERLFEEGFDLVGYLAEVKASRAAFEADRLDFHDPLFAGQAARLQALPADVFRELAALYARVVAEGDPHLMGENFHTLHGLVYRQKLVFDFRWASWEAGKRAVNDPDFDYSRCTLLECSMFLTLLFRGDRFNEGLLAEHHRRGTLRKLFHQLTRHARP